MAIRTDLLLETVLMVMQAMRENTKWIMLFTALAFVGLMVFEWGMDLTGQSGTQLSGGEVGQIDGDAITYEEWSAVYQNLYQQQSAMGIPITLATEARIAESAFDQIVTARLITRELRRRDITVTAEEIRQAARFSPPPELISHPSFQDTAGNFDVTLYHAALAQSPQLQLELESYYRDAIPRSKLFYEATAGLYVSDDELWRLYRDTNESVRVSYIPFDPVALVPNEAVTVSDAEVSTYFEENSEDFIRPARASIRYALIDRRPTAGDTVATRERIEELRTEIVDGGDFADVAAREATTVFDPDPGAERRVVRGQVAAYLEGAAFETAVGAVSEPVLGSGGFNIVKVESRTADTATVRRLTIPIELNRVEDDALLTKADSIEDFADEGMGLEEIAEQVGLEVRQTEVLPGFTAVAGVGLAEDGMYWVFEEAEVGEVSRVFESGTTMYVFEVDRLEQERPMTLEEATPTARAAVRSDKRIERARTRVREAVDRIRAGESMEDVAAAFGTEVNETDPFTRSDFVPGFGQLNPAIGTAFGLQTGQTSGVVESDRALYIIQLIERETPSREAWEAQKAEQRNRITQALAQQTWSQYIEALYENAEIVNQVNQVRAQLNG